MFIITVLLTGKSHAKKFSYNENKLGGNFKLIFFCSSKSKADKIANDTYLYIDVLNSILSNYSSASEISHLNTKKIYKTPSNELLELLNDAQLAYNKTNGYFDISIQPLIEFWNKAERINKIPTERNLKKQASKIGLNKVLNVTQNHLTLKGKGKLQLGGIAKGYIIDKVYKYIKDRGVSSFLIEAAGDIRVFGAPENKKYWKVGISSKNQSSYTISLKSGQAVATSGNTYRYRVIKGKKFSHIINPKNGLPVTHNLSASVIADNATTADYLASTFNILTSKTEIQEILNNHKDTEVLIFNTQGVFFKTEQFFN
ncbi:FAD:protein FMN transferase [Seonamhaeicola marinus]|uniref:FAD:protein FMN transferase n=1 Tax=Seonamhaeicola marinus TaxID=1912246 RepID=UPI001652ABEF|nr:FAD:protein FMN transferase [Seonamhaeicola marinus]